MNRIYPIDSIYIFNGLILDNKKSFSDYGIKNDDKIVLISSKETNRNSGLLDKWIKITEDKNHFEERMSYNIKRENRQEIARLRDIKAFKYEMKPKRFGKNRQSTMNQHLNYHSTNNNYNQIPLNLKYDHPEEPLDSALPIIW